MKYVSSLREMSQALADGEVSSAELTQDHLARIKRGGPAAEQLYHAD